MGDQAILVQGLLGMLVIMRAGACVPCEPVCSKRGGKQLDLNSGHMHRRYGGRWW